MSRCLQTGCSIQGILLPGNGRESVNKILKINTTHDRKVRLRQGAHTTETSSYSPFYISAVYKVFCLQGSVALQAR